jgi:hypothetical protein
MSGFVLREATLKIKILTFKVASPKRNKLTTFFKVLIISKYRIAYYYIKVKHSEVSFPFLL